jgi:hypothetical protein
MNAMRPPARSIGVGLGSGEAARAASPAERAVKVMNMNASVSSNPVDCFKGREFIMGDSPLSDGRVETYVDNFWSKEAVRTLDGDSEGARDAARGRRTHPSKNSTHSENQATPGTSKSIG